MRLAGLSGFLTVVREAGLLGVAQSNPAVTSLETGNGHSLLPGGDREE